MNALNLCNNRGSEMWILSCENIWVKHEIWELAGFCALLVYPSKHTIAPAYAMHCRALPAVPSQRRLSGRKHLIKKKKKILKPCSSHIKSALSSGNLCLLHSSGEEQQLSLGLGDPEGILTAALEKIRRYLGNSLRQLSQRCGAWPEPGKALGRDTGKNGQVWTRSSQGGLGPARVEPGLRVRRGG